MPTLSYPLTFAGESHALDLAFVEGTHGRPYSFGEGEGSASPRHVEVPDFYIATTPVTVALWSHVTGLDPSVSHAGRKPVENISWIDITRRPGGFLDQLNASPILTHFSRQHSDRATTVYFRLPTETEWEYAARGGPHWPQRFRFSGSNDIDAVAWHDRIGGDHTHDVAAKAPNQLGLYDMSGNVWEWCQDIFTRDVANIPADGSPYAGPAAGTDPPARILRGGCFHNWTIHCTVSKRYEIGEIFHDGCIGLRLVLSPIPTWSL